LPQSASELQVPAAHIFALQVAPELRPVQSLAFVQLFLGGMQIPALGVPEHVPVPQSVLVLQLIEQAPAASPTQPALEFKLVHSESNQQLFVVVSAQLPIDSPLQVPTPQSVSALHVKAEHVPFVTPLQVEPAIFEQSGVVRQARLQLPSLPLQVRPEGQSVAE
jgi:hypothetical protein